MNVKWNPDRKYVVIFVFFILYYLLFNTGLHGDDYSEIAGWRFQGLPSFLMPGGVALTILGSHYCFWWAYPFLGYDHQWVYDLVKVAAHILSLLCVYRFAIDYLPRDRAIMMSSLFVLYPLHDTTMYWYMTVPYVFFPAVMMYAHSLFRHEHLFPGFILALFGAFGGYFSPPYVFGLTAIFIYERKFREAVLFAFPGIIYIVYYFFIKYAFSGIEKRINSSLTIADYIRQLLLQPLSFIDAAFGPSYWLKVYYSIGSITLLSGLIVLVIVVLLLIRIPLFSKRPDVPKSLFIGLFITLVLSFAMFALTGLYHHSAFNLGNRTTVYGSLLIALLIAILPFNRKTVVVLALIFIIPLFGLSDHWKRWNAHQKNIIENIHTNSSLKALEPESTLLVTGNVYSRLGPFSHIELFSMPWVVKAIFKDSVKCRNIIAITSYLHLEKQTLVDPKFGGQYYLESPIYLYDSDKDALRLIKLSEVPVLLSAHPREIRHWVQLTKGSWIESSIVGLSPRLAYLFAKQ
ncbi:hypothetical protein G9409_01005 [Chlorobium sp. BLA1]|uniref:hypothetical protein n=1 Tax=Candidatus Chlorobium masyuteum TaxID=2716876 RepID=UPI001421998F|nr:hypothetical protein [Candidatus Chlorobium masyuteum]NHQ59179.1 hypothetical protein [Candidatus Chlorobium masyuteum]